MVSRTLQVHTEGEYLPTDVDWNKQGRPPPQRVHSLVNDVTCVIRRNMQASISLQTVAGLTNPLILVHYDAEPNHQTHFVTLLAWTMVTDHEFIALSPPAPERSRPTPSARPGSGCSPGRSSSGCCCRNYRQLMSEDVPLRERLRPSALVGLHVPGRRRAPRHPRLAQHPREQRLRPDPPPDEPPVFAPCPWTTSPPAAAPSSAAATTSASC